MESLLRPWRSIHDGNPRFESSNFPVATQCAIHIVDWFKSNCTPRGVFAPVEFSSVNSTNLTCEKFLYAFKRVHAPLRWLSQQIGSRRDRRERT